jgi:predicted nucleotidyltransferase
MTVPLVDLRGVIRDLHQERISYLVTGATAMLFYGYVRNTDDLDLLVDPDPENLGRVADWLTSLKATLRLNPMSEFGERERAGLLRGAQVSVLTRMGQIDIFQPLPELPVFSELFERAERYETGGVEVPVLDRTTLIELKRQRASYLDRADIEAINNLGARWPAE